MKKILAAAALAAMVATPAYAVTNSCYFEDELGEPIKVDISRVIVIGKVSYEVSPFQYPVEGFQQWKLERDFLAGETVHAKRLNGPRKCWASVLEYNGQASFPPGVE